MRSALSAFLASVFVLPLVAAPRPPASARWIARLLALVGLSLVNVTAADRPKEAGKVDPAVAQKLAAVKRWRGFFEVHVNGNPSRQTDSWMSQGSQDSTTHGTFELSRSDSGYWDPSRGLFEWIGDGEMRASHHLSLMSSKNDGSGMQEFEDSKGTLPLRDVTLSINLGARSAGLHPGSSDPEMPATHSGFSIQRRFDERRFAYVLERFPLNAPSKHFAAKLSLRRTINQSLVPVDYFPQIAGGPGVISVNNSDDIAGYSLNFPGGMHMTEQLLLFPIYDNIECEVTIEGYADWLPRGNIADPKKPGNALVARAVLKAKDGKTKELPQVELFRFELINTSREPGVCLNWPLKAEDTDFDLRLADFNNGSQADPLGAMRKFLSDWDMSSSGDRDAASMPSRGMPQWRFPEVSEDGQKGELPDPPKDKSGQPFAEAALECFDFGAKSELRVTCVLKDGREIIGLMKTEGSGEELVRLPKRTGSEWVADKWLNENDAMNLAANDDNEAVAGQNDNGDGFTLYEEYRGWVENGKHISGDPKKKDFFILNLVDADARGGIALFQRLSELRVHSRLRKGKEMSQEDRLMNGNHREAPHRVQQHGVAISHAAGGAGGYNVGVEGVDKTKAGRPASVQFVYVETHFDDGAFAAKSSAERYLNERDAQFAYDRAVAHELLHSVGVDHHGEYVWEFVRCNFQGASAPLNPTHHARFTTGYGLSVFQIDTAKEWSGDRGDTITLLWEDTKRDVVEDSLPAYEAELAKRRADAATESYQRDFAQDVTKMAAMGVNHDAAFWAGYYADHLASMNQTRGIRVGRFGGTDCGNELCVMRYYFANAYEMTGQKNAYYLIRPGPGANRAGREICRSPAGTGTNAASHDPQSRFGDAHAGRGNCFGDICPNDAIPPRSVVLQ